MLKTRLKTRRKFYLGCMLAAGQFTSVSGWAVVPAGHEVMPVHVGVSAVHEVMPETRPGVTHAVVSQAGAAERGVQPAAAGGAHLTVDSAARLGVDSAAHASVDTTAHPSVDSAARLGAGSAAHPGVDTTAHLSVDSAARPGADSAAHPSVDSAARLGADSAAHPSVDSAARPGADSVRSSQENLASYSPSPSLPVRPADAALGKAAPHASLLDSPDHEMTAVAVHTTPSNESHLPVSHDPVSGDSQVHNGKLIQQKPAIDQKTQYRDESGLLYTRGNITAYRFDTRPPGEIMKSGFQGTINTDHVFVAFDKNTVIASETMEGARKFAESAIAATGKSYFLYEINTKNKTWISYSENYRMDGDLTLRNISKSLFNKNQEQYSATSKYKKLGHDKFIEYLSGKLKSPIGEAFIPVREVHIEGPVPPDEIKPLH